MFISHTFLSDRKRPEANQVNVRAGRSAAAEALSNINKAPVREGGEMGSLPTIGTGINKSQILFPFKYGYLTYISGL